MPVEYIHTAAATSAASSPHPISRANRNAQSPAMKNASRGNVSPFPIGSRQARSVTGLYAAGCAAAARMSPLRMNGFRSADAVLERPPHHLPPRNIWLETSERRRCASHSAVRLSHAEQRFGRVRHVDRCVNRVGQQRPAVKRSGKEEKAHRGARDRSTVR